MKAKFTIAALVLSLISSALLAQPLVYDKENTGAHYPKPSFPSYDQLPLVQPLPDPFVFFDGSGRNASFSSWERRRNEIKSSIEKYEIGPKPDRSDVTISATYAPGVGGGVLTVVVLRNSNGVSLTLTSKVSLPSGTAPAAGWPAVIGMSLAPSGGPVNNSIAKIDFMHDNVTQYAAGQQVSHAGDPYFRMYPEYNAGPCPPSPAPCGQQVGQYSAWAWGVSRLIDGMEIAAKQPVNPLPIDIKHLGVNGCSYAGKMALFAGAFDERIAATWAQESGGGGAPAWRVSHAIEPDGTVEKTNNTDGSWFITGMKTDFGGNNVYKLPHDHHELQAMIAPRALFVSGNTDFVWLSNRSTYVTAKATQKIYETLGVGDRYGYWIDGGHGHCALGTGQQAVIDGFYNKFLLGQDASWDVHVAPAAFSNIDHERWYGWWGTGNPSFPPEPASKKIWMDAECAAVGSNWDIVADATASNGKYVTVKAGLNSTASAPADNAANQVVFSFTIDSAASYNILGRTIGATADDDSYWVRVDNGPFVTANGLTSTSWSWGMLASTNLSIGQHTLTITYREDGAKLDKVLITTSGALVTGLGEPGCNGLPVVEPNQSFTINDRAENGAVVGMVTATDPDANTTLQGWQIDGGTGAGKFSINDSSGEVTVWNRTAIDFDNTTSYTLQVSVSDGVARSAAETVTIHLTNVPVIIPSQVFEINEWVTDNYLVGIAKATDKDQNTTLGGWKIVGGTGASVFAIDAATGEIRSTNSSTVNFSKTPGYTLILTVSDGSNTSTEETVTINVSDKVYVCHANRSMLVQRSKVPDHIKHGDKTGTCTSSSNEARMMTSSEINVAALSNRISVYPNPAKGHININLGTNDTRVQRIQVVDLSGKLVTQMLVSKNSSIILPAGTLKAGTYIIRFVGDKVSNQKIVVQ